MKNQDQDPPKRQPRKCKYAKYTNKNFKLWCYIKFYTVRRHHPPSEAQSITFRACAPVHIRPVLLIYINPVNKEKSSRTEIFDLVWIAHGGLPRQALKGT